MASSVPVGAPVAPGSHPRPSRPRSATRAPSRPGSTPPGIRSCCGVNPRSRSGARSGSSARRLTRCRWRRRADVAGPPPVDPHRRAGDHRQCALRQALRRPPQRPPLVHFRHPCAARRTHYPAARLGFSDIQVLYPRDPHVAKVELAVADPCGPDVQRTKRTYRVRVIQRSMRAFRVGPSQRFASGSRAGDRAVACSS